jgi:hypothetical protein
MGPMMANGSPPEAIAEIVYDAATDGTDRLRYEGGADAIGMLANRRAVDDAGFLADMQAMFGIAAPDRVQGKVHEPA